MLETERLILRRWESSDAPYLFEYAKDPDIGTPAGWQPHRSIGESEAVIRDVLSAPEIYAVSMKARNCEPVGSIGLHFGADTDMTDRDDECELGYWIGKPFWGQGLIPEAVREVIRHAFMELGLAAVWCGYYEGNEKSRRVQEKCGFVYQRRTEGLYIRALDEYRTGHCTLLTREQWERRADK